VAEKQHETSLNAATPAWPGAQILLFCEWQRIMSRTPRQDAEPRPASAVILPFRKPDPM
jgi:hypothetical protein